MEELDRFMAEYAGHTFSQIRDLVRTDPEFRARLETLYAGVYHRRLNKGCTSCWTDAYVLLRRTNIETLKTMAKRQFELRAGALLVDVVNHDNAKMATHHNLTDELAIYHLRTCPGYITKFSKYPANWREVVGLDKKPAATPEEKLKTAEDRLTAARQEGDPRRIGKAQARVDRARAALERSRDEKTGEAGEAGETDAENK